jgi:hypothetical protein
VNEVCRVGDQGQPSCVPAVIDEPPPKPIYVSSGGAGVCSVSEVGAAGARAAWPGAASLFALAALVRRRRRAA